MTPIALAHRMRAASTSERQRGGFSRSSCTRIHSAILALSIAACSGELPNTVHFRQASGPLEVSVANLSSPATLVADLEVTIEPDGSAGNSVLAHSSTLHFEYNRTSSGEWHSLSRVSALDGVARPLAPSVAVDAGVPSVFSSRGDILGNGQRVALPLAFDSISGRLARERLPRMPPRPKQLQRSADRTSDPLERFITRPSSASARRLQLTGRLGASQPAGAGTERYSSDSHGTHFEMIVDSTSGATLRELVRTADGSVVEKLHSYSPLPSGDLVRSESRIFFSSTAPGSTRKSLRFTLVRLVIE